MNEIITASGTGLAADVKSGKRSAADITQAFLDRIEALNPGLNALLSVNAEQALADARALDARIRKGESAGNLAGLPVVLKDNICVEGQVTSCASHMLENYRPPYNAWAAECIRAQDGIIIAKANMDEFAMGSSTENSGFGPVLNPRCPDRVPGGSSGGSAAAVAAGLAPVSLGSDTGGSIRQPASHCGVVGLKPTYGRVSRFGLVAFGSSLDQIGPFGRSAADVKLLLSAISAPDPRDGTNKGLDATGPEPPVPMNFKGRKVGIPKEYIVEGISADVMEIFSRARRALSGQGAEIVDISIPHTEYGVSVYYVIACAEASSNLARFDGAHYGHRAAEYSDLISMFCASRREGFGDEVKRRIILGTHVLSAGYYDAYYNKALKVRSLLKQDFLKAFEQCDVIMCPVAPTPAFKMGEFVDNPLEMYLSDIFTISVNLAGVPAISVPGGETPAGLPVGVQFIGPAFSEDRLLSCARGFEEIRDFEVTVADFKE